MGSMAASSPPRFAAALSTASETSAAIDEVCRQTLSALGGTPDLALAFVSHDHAAQFESLGEQLCRRLGCQRLLGASGESIVGSGREIEQAPALSLWLAALPGVELTPLRLDFERTPEGGTFLGWPDNWDELSASPASLLLLGEPFSFPADALLERLNEDRPGLTVVGGMASGAFEPGKNRLFLGEQSIDSGAVGMLMRGVGMRSVVSQGCRPIGQPLVVTKAQQNVIEQLGGQPPLEQLRALWPSLSPREQGLVQQGLHVGQVINEYQPQFRRGDFLVRNVVGADPQHGVLAIGDFVRPGQTVQFHVRDAQTADEDLRELLIAARDQRPAAAALLFTCNGRGTRLFSEPHHDAAALADVLGDIPVAGFFAQGEIGPVGGKNFLHGFTASVVLFDAAE
jgi:small ligand-binding sensory domain FIST